MIYNTAVIRKEAVNESSSTSLLQNMLYITESEGKMFDSLINIDFMDALNEADLSEQEEDYETGNGATQPDQDTGDEPAKKKKLWDIIKQIAKKIWDLLKKVGEAIANAFKSLGAKLGEIVGTNKGLVAKYGKYVTDQANLEGFPGLENFPVDPNFFKDWEEEEKQCKAIINSVAKELVNSVSNLTEESSESRKTILDDLANRIEAGKKSGGAAAEVEMKTGTFTPNAAYMKNVIDQLDKSSERVKAINQMGKDALQLIDLARQSAKRQEGSVESKIRRQVDNDYAVAWKDYYSALAKISQFINWTCQTSVKLTKVSTKYARRAMIEVGKFAYDKANGKQKDLKGFNKEESKEKANESAAFAKVLGYVSDVYVESVFEM